jgi:hypothetical protein
MKRCLSVFLVLIVAGLSQAAAQNKKKGLDFVRDIQPILLSLSAEERSLVLDWAEQGAEIPLISGHGAAEEESDVFRSKIAPLFARHCLECHDSGVREGALDLSRKEEAFKGGDSGDAILPGNAEESYLWESVFFDDMPEDRPPLSQEQKDVIKQWIDDGAEWTVDWIDPVVYESEDRGENWIRRLTVDEYIETVFRATGVDIEKEARELLPQDKRADGFSNTAYNLNVDLDHVRAYAQLAGIIVERMDIMKFATRFQEDFKYTDDDGILISEMGKWLLRGPLDKWEIASYRGISTTIASAAGSLEEVASLMIEGMLQSPRFIYRMEKQKGDGSASPINEYELASRLSYILWGGPPDEALLNAADKGELKYPFELEAQVKRMLNDPRAIIHSAKFIYEWLDLERLDNLRPNPEKFPEWNPELASDMREETLAYFKEVVWNQNRPLGDLLNTKVTFASASLADFYGLHSDDATTEEDGLARFDLTDNRYRGGLLTQGSVLTIGGDEASMVTRGLFVLHDLLRGTVKPPPPELDVTPVPSSPGESNRVIAMTRINDKSCGGCHGRFEPLAFGLEKFDGIGSFSHKDDFGNQLREDGEVVIPGYQEPVSYDTASQLMDILAKSDRVSQTLTWKVAQWAMGRPLTAADAPTLDRIHEISQKEGGTYPSVMTALVLSDLVQTVRTEYEQTPVN